MGDWIKCSERMPEVGQQVLAANCRFHLYETATFDYGHVSGKPIFGTSNGNFFATHWQPLPSPPEDV